MTVTISTFEGLLTLDVSEIRDVSPSHVNVGGKRYHPKHFPDDFLNIISESHVALGDSHFVNNNACGQVNEIYHWHKNDGVEVDFDDAGFRVQAPFGSVLRTLRNADCNLVEVAKDEYAVRHDILKKMATVSIRTDEGDMTFTVCPGKKHKPSEKQCLCHITALDEDKVTLTSRKWPVYLRDSRQNYLTLQHFYEGNRFW